MALVSVFLMNLLCALVPCDPEIPYPEIHGMEVGFRGKRLISGVDDGDNNNYPIVTTTNGQVQGYPMLVMSGRKIFAFEGITYGNSERFQVCI